MELNHINLPVADVAQARAFFETYFGFRCVLERGPNFVGLIDDAGLALVLSNPDGVSAVDYPKYFHIGFMQDDDTKVDAIYERLKADGIDVEQPRSSHGSWTFYFTAPGGVTIEVQHQHRGLGHNH